MFCNSVWQTIVSKEARVISSIAPLRNRSSAERKEATREEEAQAFVPGPPAAAFRARQDDESPELPQEPGSFPVRTEVRRPAAQAGLALRIPLIRFAMKKANRSQC